MATEKQLTLWSSVGLPNSSLTYITRSEMALYDDRAETYKEVYSQI